MQAARPPEKAQAPLAAPAASTTSTKPKLTPQRTWHSLASPPHSGGDSFVSVDTGRTLRRTDAFTWVDGKPVFYRADAAQSPLQTPK